MKTLHALATWPLRSRLLAIAGLCAVVIAGAVLGPPELFFFVLAIGIAFSGVAGFWLGARWLLVPLIAMGVEILIAAPATLVDPSAGETPISVVLEAPFWTGIPAFVGALVGGISRLAIDRSQRRTHQTAG
jgi:hypothetical protein